MTSSPSKPSAAKVPRILRKFDPKWRLQQVAASFAPVLPWRMLHAAPACDRTCCPSGASATARSFAAGVMRRRSSCRSQWRRR